MKPITTFRKWLYPALVVFCTAFAAVIFLNGSSKTTYPTLKQRSGALAQAPEWAETQKTFEQLIVELTRKPGDVKTTLQLAKLFMNEGRASGDFSYYNLEALKLIDQVLNTDSNHFEATCLKSMILLSQHRFQEAQTLAAKAAQTNPHNAFVYGLQVDAHVELGEYQQAVATCDRMVQIRPDIRSYSRVSYLRELHGDFNGAVEAIEQAITSGVAGREETEWARMVLAHLYEDSNQLEKAKNAFETALQFRPNYPFAWAGLGRIARYNKDYPKAIDCFEKAVKVMNEVAFFTELAELYQLNQQPEKAAQCFQVTIQALEADNEPGVNGQVGHNADFELAQLYLKAGQFEKGLKHAEAEYNRRPNNIDACEWMAWALFLNGQTERAAPIALQSLKTQSQKPERLVKSGIILSAVGQKDTGTALIKQGLQLKPYLDESLVTRTFNL